MANQYTNPLGIDWTEKDPDKLLADVKRHCIEDPETGCLLWQRAKNSLGYAEAWIGGRMLRIHRVLLEAWQGRPLEHLALHLCHRRACVNPEHLYEGTHADNARDCIEAGRHRYVTPVLSGEANGATKLRASDLPKVFELRAAGWAHRRIGDAVGLSKTQIRRILSGEYRAAETLELRAAASGAQRRPPLTAKQTGMDPGRFAAAMGRASGRAGG